jgi:hypothetical protein
LRKIIGGKIDQAAGIIKGKIETAQKSSVNNRKMLSKAANVSGAAQAEGNTTKRMTGQYPSMHIPDTLRLEELKP